VILRALHNFNLKFYPINIDRFGAVVLIVNFGFKYHGIETAALTHQCQYARIIPLETGIAYKVANDF
jgi:hypothetical protein